MNVIVLNDHGWISGGQAKIAIESALKLKARGLNVCFIAGAGPLDDRLGKAGIDCYAVGDHDILSDPNRLRAAGRGIWNVSAARILASCLAARDPVHTVVHAHGWAKALSPSIGPILTRSDVAHVYTMHEYFLACPNGGFFNYKKREICTKRPMGLGCLTSRCDSRNDFHKAWRVARQAVLRTAGELPQGLREIIYLAPQQKSIMADAISEKARWHFLPNPVREHSPTRVEAERNDTFVFIGRMSPEKGAEIAARGAKAAGVPIAFCGNGPMEDAVRSANPDAIMLGWLDDAKVRQWLRKARCLVFPSLWYECYPLVIADALALGVPIMVSNGSVAASMVADGSTGLLVETGNVQAWADAMSRLQSNDLVHDLSVGAFAAGQYLMSYDAYIDELINIYRQVISRKHGQTQSAVEQAALC
jgi:glycosyltransferase involved in cell wall biosynthesis